jgi:hypothetical protein
VTPQGLRQRDATGQCRIFKADPADEYEFTAQLTQDGRVPPDGGTHRLGMLPVYVDDQNYLQAEIDLAKRELRVSGRQVGKVLPVQTAPLPVRFPLPTSERIGQLWHYTLELPGTGWTAPDFSSDGWPTGAGGFGGTAARTPWNTEDLWLRRDFNLDEAPTCMARLRLQLQGNAEIYLNGVLAMQGSNSVAGYVAQEITNEARETLKQGRNTLVIHAH